MKMNYSAQQFDIYNVDRMKKYHASRIEYTLTMNLEANTLN